MRTAKKFTLLATGLVLLGARPARADAPEWGGYLSDQLRRLDDDGGEAGDIAASPGTPALAHILLTLRGEVDVGLRGLGTAALQPELIFVFAAPDAKP